MQYTRLRSFHAVATAGGFNAAAAAFNISQPTLSAQVGALEDEYGLELFVKKGRRRELSDSGRQLLAITTRLFAEEDEAVAFLEQSRELKHGKLSIGAVGPYHVTEMLAAFNRTYPGIDLAVKLGNSTDVLGDLLDYKSDVAVLALSMRMLGCSPFRIVGIRSPCSSARTTGSRAAKASRSRSSTGSR
jgi:DNA-binding transcriptional LysR family regulator